LKESSVLDLNGVCRCWWKFHRSVLTDGSPVLGGIAPKLGGGTLHSRVNCDPLSGSFHRILPTENPAGGRIPNLIGSKRNLRFTACRGGVGIANKGLNGANMQGPVKGLSLLIGESEDCVHDLAD
jgi:hypothetical protein